MTVLFLGYSNLFKNRLIPALNQLPEIDEIHIAKFKDQEWDYEYRKLTCPKKVLWDCYEKALKRAKVDIVYISTVNSSHYDLAKAALEKGWHTIIDKPMCLSYEETKDLFKRADGLEQQVLLSESLVYTYHPQFKVIKEIFEEKEEKIKLINVIFSIPPLDSNNFRYKKEFGGGALNDMGPYAVSLGRYFYNEEPKKVHCIIHEKQNDVEISYNIILEYPNNKIVNGYFGFKTQYMNTMTVISDNIKLNVDRIFTIPDNINPHMKIVFKEREYFQTSKIGNTFLLYFEDILDAIKNKDYLRHKNNILTDSKTLDKLRHKI